jgi:hypothetical protein
VVLLGTGTFREHRSKLSRPVVVHVLRAAEDPDPDDGGTDEHLSGDTRIVEHLVAPASAVALVPDRAERHFGPVPVSASSARTAS